MTIVERLKAKDSAAINEAVENHVGLVRYIINKHFKSASRGRVQDVFAEGMKALVEAVNTFQSSPNPNLTSYISTCVKGDIKDFFYADKTVRIPKTAISEGEQEVKVIHDVEYRPKRNFEQNEIETNEIASVICEDDFERKVLELLLEGYNGSEIAEQFSCPLSYIRDTRDLLRIRYLLKDRS